MVLDGRLLKFNYDMATMKYSEYFNTEFMIADVNFGRCQHGASCAPSTLWNFEGLLPVCSARSTRSTQRT